MPAARPVAVDVPVVGWAEFWPKFCRAYRFDRDDAQHVSIIGPTRTGKSTLAMAIASRRHYVAGLFVKGRDEPVRKMLRDAGYHRVHSIPAPGRSRRVFLWYPYRGEADVANQRLQLATAMDDAFNDGVWHLWLDEAQHMVDRLRLDGRIVSWLRMGRTQGNGLILCCQRPSYMPRDIYSAPRHLFLFGTNDERDLRSIGGMNGINNRTVRDTVATLGKTHRVLYIDTQTGDMAVTRYERTATP